MAAYWCTPSCAEDLLNIIMVRFGLNENKLFIFPLVSLHPYITHSKIIAKVMLIVNF